MEPLTSTLIGDPSLNETHPPLSPSGPLQVRAWTVLFGALALAGGHGAFLFTALSSTGAFGKLTEVGRGRLGGLAVGWLLAAPLLALLALMLRRPLMRSRIVTWLAWAAALATASAFALYLTTVVRTV